MQILGPAEQLVFNQAIAEYTQHTCINWVERQAPEQHYIRIFRGGGCYSYIGKVTQFSNFNGKQDMSLANGCLFVSITIFDWIRNFSITSGCLGSNESI